jgi:uncharacterized membrane protein YphA (DoxX/SURF4 family)
VQAGSRRGFEAVSIRGIVIRQAGEGDTTMKRNTGLWIGQAVLAFVFMAAGVSKLILPAEQMAGPVPIPLWFLRSLGAVEVLGALGMILPGLLRIRPGLTPLAAAGMVIILIGAVVITAVGGEVVTALIPLVIGVLAAWVAHGRWPWLNQAPGRAIHPARI